MQKIWFYLLPSPKKKKWQNLSNQHILQTARYCFKGDWQICGEIEMLESKHVLRVDQVELETVILQVGVGGLVKIVNKEYQWSIVRLLGVDTDHFCAKVQMEKCAYDGRVLKAVEYEEKIIV